MELLGYVTKKAPGTSPALDTRGASLLVAFISNYAPGSAGSITADSQSNSWSGKTPQSIDNIKGRFFIVENPSTSATHTIDFAGTGAGLIFAAFSGTAISSSIEEENGYAAASVNSIQPGSVNPDNDGSLILAGCAVDLSITQTIDSGFSLVADVSFEGGVNEGLALAYKFQSTAASINPQFGGGTTNGKACCILVIKPAPPDTTPPSDVTNLATTKISNSRVDIDSDAATDNIAVAGYQTQVSSDGGTTWNTISSTAKSVSFVSGNAYFPIVPGIYSLTFRRKAFDTASTPNYSLNWSTITDPVSVNIPVTPPDADFTIEPSTVVVGGTVVLTDTSTHSPTSRQWQLDDEDLATTSPYNLDTTGFEIGTHTIDLLVENAGGNDTKSMTFEVIDSIVAQYFERLELCKIFNITSLGLDMPLLSADFGDGYGAGILSGKSSGLRLWAISAELLPDLSEYSLDFTVDEETETATYFQYFWDFFKRHIALGNKPFYFTDPRTNRKFLASFTEPRLSFEAFTAKLYSGGVQIKQRRAKVEDLTFRDEDGSINE